MVEATSLLKMRLIALYTAGQSGVSDFYDQIAEHRVAYLLDSAERHGKMARVEGIESYSDALTVEAQLVSPDVEESGDGLAR